MQLAAPDLLTRRALLAAMVGRSRFDPITGWLRLGWVLAAIATLWSPPASAAMASADCSVVWTEEWLPLPDREFMVQVCAMPEVSRRLLEEIESAGASGDPPSPDAARLQRLLKDIARLRYSAALFKTLGLYRPADEKAKASGPVEELVRGVITDTAPCSTKPKKVAPREAAEPQRPLLSKPSGAALLLEKLKRDCRGQLVSQLSARSSPDRPDPALLLVVAARGDRVMLAHGGPLPSVKELTGTSSSRLNDWDGKEVFFALVPRNAPYSVAVFRPGVALPLWWGGIMKDDDVLWAFTELACLELDMAIEPSAQVFVDGSAVALPTGHASQRVHLYLDTTVDVHRIRVVEQGRSVVLDGAVAEDELSTKWCHVEQHDLRRRAWSQAVALLNAGVSGDCVQAGIDPARLRMATTQATVALGLTLKDLQTWQSSARHLADLQEAVASLDSANGRSSSAAGAGRGRFDTAATLATSAREFVRQGFSKMLSVQLFCTRSRGLHDHQFSVHTRVLDLDKVVSRDRDAMTGVSLEDVVRGNVEVVRGASGLSAAIAASVARVLDGPSVRIVRTPRALWFHEEAELDLEVFEPPAAGSTGGGELVISVFDGSSLDSRRVCESRRTAGSLEDFANEASETGGSWRVVSRSLVPVRSTQQLVHLPFAPRRTGYAVIRAELRSGMGTRSELHAADYACIEFVKPMANLWGEVHLLGTAPYLGEAFLDPVRKERYSGWLVTAGVSWRRVPVGLWLGYLNALRHGSVPPDWSDIQAGGYSSQGTQPYGLREHSLLVGVLLNPELDGCEGLGWCSGFGRRFSSELRLMGHFATTVFDKSHIPATLSHFAEPEKELDPKFDFGFAVEALARVQTTDQSSVSAGVMLAAPRMWGSSCWDWNCSSRVTFDRRIVYGTSLGVAWAL